MNASRALARVVLCAVAVTGAVSGAGCASAPAGSASPDEEASDDGGAGDPVPVVPPPPAATVGASALLAEAQSIVATMKSTHYQHASSIDRTTGTYDVDCSGFVNYALGLSVSDAYDVLVKATVTRPVAESYVTFVGGLSTPRGRWSNVHLVKNLVPGDLLAWRTPANVKSSDTGHVMIIEKAPTIAGNQAQVAVIDSTETGHGDVDPRLPKGPNGIGRGTTVVMMNDDGTAYGYRWSMDSDSPPFATDVVMAHLD